MKQPNVQWVKFLPWLLALMIIATAVVGIVWITSQPDVIRAKGDWANATANLYQAKQAFHEKLPDILSKATVLAVAALLSFAGMAFILSVSINMVIYNVDRVVAHGWEFEKNAGGQKTTYKLLHTNPVPYKTPGQPKITVENPIQGMLGKGGNQALPQGNGKGGNQHTGNIPTGRPLKPEERQAPGRNPLHNNNGAGQGGGVPQALASGTQQKISKDDPLSILDETTI